MSNTTLSNRRSLELEYVTQLVTELAAPYAQLDITLREETPETLREYSDFDRQRLGIHSPGEYFVIAKDGHTLYAVNVTCDSVLTAASELMRLIACKF